MSRRLDDWDLADHEGERPRSPVTPDVLVAAERILHERRAVLLGEVGALARQAADVGARPQYGKRIGDHTSDAVESRKNAIVEGALRARLAEVDAALERIARGSYGRCARCGRVIDAERLRALPWATACVICP